MCMHFLLIYMYAYLHSLWTGIKYEKNVQDFWNLKHHANCVLKSKCSSHNPKSIFKKITAGFYRFFNFQFKKNCPISWFSWYKSNSENTFTHPTVKVWQIKVGLICYLDKRIASYCNFLCLVGRSSSQGIKNCHISYWLT